MADLPSTPKGSSYKCAVCEGVFTTQREDAEAHAERETLWGDDPGVEGWMVICDDCFERAKRMGIIPVEGEVKN